jgi:glutaredoxin
MMNDLVLYTRKDCGLCEEMKQVIGQLATRLPLNVQELDIDSSAELEKQFGNEVPVLFINGRKAFKYRVTTKELEKTLKKQKISPVVSE